MSRSKRASSSANVLLKALTAAMFFIESVLPFKAHGVTPSVEERGN